MIASEKINNGGHGMPVYWKKAIVPKSPIAQPNKHQDVLYEALFQVLLQVQDILDFKAVVDLN